MDERSRVILDLINADDSMSWVRDQLVASISEGIVQSAKDRVPDIVTAGLSAHRQAVSPREKMKRDKYETSRPYDEAEKVTLISYALHEVFVTVPALQVSCMNSLKEFDPQLAGVNFIRPDEEESSDGDPAHSLNMNAERANDLRRRFEEFKKILEA